MLDNLSYEKELIKNFQEKPEEYKKEFENYMIRVCEKKIGITSEKRSIDWILMVIGSKYPKVQGECDIIYSHFGGPDSLSINEKAQYLVRAILQIKNARNEE